MSLPNPGQPFVTGSKKIVAGTVPQVSSVLTWRDHFATVKARWGIGRMSYTVDPGLYAIGNPDESSPVLASANYKMSFDRLRETLHDRDAWILVLDTKGINVWCSAGKGTFGTAELVRRILNSGISQIVSHRNIILPQLAGPGVAAHRVKEYSGFKVNYGPVQARDLPAYLDAGCSALPEMRIKTFTLWERIALVPLELIEALKIAVFILPIAFFLGGLGGPGEYWDNALHYGTFASAAILGAVLVGTILIPILLPFLPGRAFSVKGLWFGLLTALILVLLRSPDMGTWTGQLETVAWFFLVTSIMMYLAMNFTGASTYTSLSGVRKEMRWALPVEIASGIAGIVLWLGSRFTA